MLHSPLRDLRTALGLTQREFEDETGLSSGYAAQLETAVNGLGASAALRISSRFGPEMERLGIAVEDLIRGFYPPPAADSSSGMREGAPAYE